MSKEIILVVEDDEFVREGLVDILEEHDYSVLKAASGHEAIAIFGQSIIDLILLDINLGDKNGFDLCRQIRQESDIPIIFLTAYSDEMNLVRGLNIGADDYITKPFRLQELLARINALMRRKGRSIKAQINCYCSGDLFYYPLERKIEKEKQRLFLTPIEIQIIDCLIQNYPNTVSRENLLYRIWDKDGDFVDDNTLNVHISRLRDKLGTYKDTSYVKTMRGMGYVWGVFVK